MTSNSRRVRELTDNCLLIGARIMQSLGAAAAGVLAHTIVADLFQGTAMTRFFSTLMLAAALMFAAVFAYIFGSSFVLQEVYGLTAQQFSLIFAANGLGIVFLGQAGGFLVGRAATEHTLLRVSLTVATLAGLGVLLCAALGLPLPLLLACLFVVVSMLGIVLANATSLALAGHSSTGGAASSLQGYCSSWLAASPRTGSEPGSRCVR